MAEKDILAFDSVDDAIAHCKGKYRNPDTAPFLLCANRKFKGDGGGGTFRVRTKMGEETDNGGTIRALGGNRILEYVKTGAYIPVTVFGAIRDGLNVDIKKIKDEIKKRDFYVYVGGVPKKVTYVTNVNDTTAIANMNTLAFNNAVLAEENLFIPPGVYLLGRTETQNQEECIPAIGMSTDSKGNRDNRTITGAGNASVLKLMDGADPEFYMFVGGDKQEVIGWTFSNFKVDLNGENNSQDAWDAAHRNNQFIYAHCPCFDMTIENILIENAPGAQVIFIKIPSKNITIKNVCAKNFGSGLRNSLGELCNKLIDISVFYIVGSQITIENCLFVCDDPDLQSNDDQYFYNVKDNGGYLEDENGDKIIKNPGHSAIELHPSDQVIISNCHFKNVKVPIGIYSDFDDVEDVIITDSTFKDCIILAVISSGVPNLVNSIHSVHFNNLSFTSSKSEAHVLEIGESWEVNNWKKTLAPSSEPYWHKSLVRNVFVKDCFFNFENTDCDWNHFIEVDARLLKSVSIEGCKFYKLRGSVFRLRQSNLTFDMTIVIKNNIMDSCGDRKKKGAPNQLYFGPAHGGRYEKPPVDIVIQGNIFMNSDDLDYSKLGHICIDRDPRIGYEDILLNAGWIVISDNILIDSQYFLLKYDPGAVGETDYFICKNNTGLANLVPPDVGMLDLS